MSTPHASYDAWQPVRSKQGVQLNLQTAEARQRLAVKRVRRGRKATIDPTRVWEAADTIEAVLGPGFHLAHTHRMGWLLRQLESRPEDEMGRARMKYVDVDQAPDGQLGALLLRHQQRERIK